MEKEYERRLILNGVKSKYKVRVTECHSVRGKITKSTVIKGYLTNKKILDDEKIYGKYENWLRKTVKPTSADIAAFKIEEVLERGEFNQMYKVTIEPGDIIEGFMHLGYLDIILNDICITKPSGAKLCVYDVSYKLLNHMTLEEL